MLTLLGTRVGVGDGAELAPIGVGVGAAADEVLTLPQPAIPRMAAAEMIMSEIFEWWMNAGIPVTLVARERAILLGIIDEWLILNETEGGNDNYFASR